MVYVIAFDHLHGNYELTAFMVSPSNILFPAKIAVNASKIDLFSLCVLVTVFEYQNLPDAV